VLTDVRWLTTATWAGVGEENHDTVIETDGSKGRETTMAIRAYCCTHFDSRKEIGEAWIGPEKKKNNLAGKNRFGRLIPYARGSR